MFFSLAWSSCLLQALKTLESAIVSSPLGLNPTVDGQRLIVAIPPWVFSFAICVWPRWGIIFAIWTKFMLITLIVFFWMCPDYDHFLPHALQINKGECPGESILIKLLLFLFSGFHIPPINNLWFNPQALCKVVAKSAEDVKQSIRRARQKVPAYITCYG